MIGCWMRLQLMLAWILQFHGQESARVTEVRERYGLPVMKAVAIAGPKDVARAHAYADVVDRLMFDAKPKDATRPGGNALAFDWQLISDTVDKTLDLGRRAHVRECGGCDCRVWCDGCGCLVRCGRCVRSEEPGNYSGLHCRGKRYLNSNGDWLGVAGGTLEFPIMW